ncbi:MAG: HlyD family secretion protein [Microcystaceae cyanobacterium]
MKEGESVTRNQLLVRLDNQEIQAQLGGAIASLNFAQQQELQARLQIDAVESQIEEINLNLQQSQVDAQSQVAQAQSSVAVNMAQLNESQAQLERSQAELKLAEINRDRFAYLIEEGAVTQEQFEQAQTNLETAQATVKAHQASVKSFQKLVEVAQGQLIQAQTTTLNPKIRKAQLSRLKTQLAQAHLQLIAVQAEVTNAQMFQQEIQSRIKDLNIISPIDGLVINRLVEPGEVVSVGTSLLTVINPNNIYLRGYIPEKEIGKIKIGQKAQIFLDSAPETPLSATVTTIDPQASFTPENVYFPEDRVKQVFGLKITLDQPQGFAKPGLPADAKILPESKE